MNICDITHTWQSDRKIALQKSIQNFFSVHWSFLSGWHKCATCVELHYDLIRFSYCYLYVILFSSDWIWSIRSPSIWSIDFCAGWKCIQPSTSLSIFHLYQIPVQLCSTSVSSNQTLLGLWGWGCVQKLIFMSCTSRTKIHPLLKHSPFARLTTCLAPTFSWPRVWLCASICALSWDTT